MVWLRRLTGTWVKELLQCRVNLDFPFSFGEKLCLHLCILAIAVVLLPSRMGHPIKLHSRRSLTSATCAFGDVLHMCMFKRINAKDWDLIWRSMCLLDTLQDTKVGSSTILSPRRPSFVSVLNLMKESFP